MDRPVRFKHTFMVFPNSLNNLRTLFGGVLLSEMDKAAAMLARKALYHTGADGAVTASMDKVNFEKPAHVNDIVEISCEIKKFGHSSLEIRAKVIIESPEGDRTDMCNANFTFVAIKDGKPFIHRLTFNDFEHTKN